MEDAEQPAKPVVTLVKQSPFSAAGTAMMTDRQASSRASSSGLGPIQSDADAQSVDGGSEINWSSKVQSKSEELRKLFGLPDSEVFQHFS